MSRPGLAAAAVVAALGVAAIAFLTSAEDSNLGELIVGRVDEIRSEGVVYVSDLGLFVVATENGFKALWDDARHIGDRVLYCSLDETFSSPAHGEKFDREGRYIAGPASGDLGIYPVHIRGNQVVVDISSGPQLPQRSNGEFAGRGALPCHGPEDPPGFYSNDTP